MTKSAGSSQIKEGTNSAVNTVYGDRIANCDRRELEAGTAGGEKIVKNMKISCIFTGNMLQ